MLQIKEDGSFAAQNEMRIPTDISNIHAVGTRVSHEDIKEITSKFSSIFEGIGKIMDIKAIKNYMSSLV